MRTQASSIIACDLFTVESVRLKTLHVLFFIDLHTNVLIGGVTDGAANAAWCAQIARNLTEAQGQRPNARKTPENVVLSRCCQGANVVLDSPRTRLVGPASAPVGRHAR